MKQLIKIILIMVVFLNVRSSVYAIPSFPGAEGFGSTTPGGRGGKIYRITNVNDSGTGSLRDCLTAVGISSSNESDYKRICVFAVGGIINLTSEVDITHPYLTVAGQTAPGGGVLINGPYSSDALNGGANTFTINTHDVIIRGLRIRSVNRSAIGLYPYPETAGRVHHVIIDHNSLSWSTDTILDSWWDPYDFTFSWNIIANPIPPSSDPSHNYGNLIGGRSDCVDATHPAARYVTIHHNLYANANDRTPFIKQQTVSPEVINNVDYNWYWYATKTWASAAIIGNYYIKGINTTNNSSIAVQANSGECNVNTLLPGTVYVIHNLGPARISDTLDDWKLVDTNNSTVRTNSPPFALSSVTVDDPVTAKNKVLAGAGATVPIRDSIDQSLIAELNNTCVTNYSCSGKGFFSSPTQAVLPIIDSGTLVIDTDSDGMPDGWETAHGLNSASAADANSDRNGDGYTNIEEYINSFYPVSSVDATLTPVPTISPSPKLTNMPLPTPTPTAKPTVITTPVPTPVPSLQCPPTGSTGGGVATMSVTVSQPGNYKLWVQMMGSGDAANTLWLKFDNLYCVKVGDLAGMPSGIWSWVDYKNGNITEKIPIPLIAAGTHTITLIGNALEPGVKVDRVLFTRDATCVPTGSGDTCIGVVSTPTPTITATPTVTSTPKPTSTPTATPVPAASPVITTTYLPSGRRNVFYNTTIIVTDATSGDTLRLTAKMLPLGLSVKTCKLTFGFSGVTAVCTLSGIPRARGTFSSRFTAIDGSNHRTTKLLKIQIR
jgi:pectate lyase